MNLFQYESRTFSLQNPIFNEFYYPTVCLKKLKNFPHPKNGFDSSAQRTVKERSCAVKKTELIIFLFNEE